MSRNVNDIIRKLTPRQRKKVGTRAAQLIAEEMTHRQLRQACRLTEQKVAKSLRIGQEGVSKIERRRDLLIPTLREYVQAIGGQLSLRCRVSRQKAGGSWWASRASPRRIASRGF